MSSIRGGGVVEPTPVKRSRLFQTKFKTYSAWPEKPFFSVLSSLSLSTGSKGIFIKKEKKYLFCTQGWLRGAQDTRPLKRQVVKPSLSHYEIYSTVFMSSFVCHSVPQFLAKSKVCPLAGYKHFTTKKALCLFANLDNFCRPGSITST